MYLCMNVCVYICDTHCCCGFPSRASTPPHKAKATYPIAGSLGETVAATFSSHRASASLSHASLPSGSWMLVLRQHALQRHAR